MTDAPDPPVQYAVIAADGFTVTQTGTCPASLLALQGGDLIAVEAPEDVTDATHYWDGAAFHTYPERPGPWARFDIVSRAWTDPRTEADHAAERARSYQALRIERDRRLTACDWTQVSDNPLPEVQREAWRYYRQALRDLPELTADPADPVWPLPPTA